MFRSIPEQNAPRAVIVYHYLLKITEVCNLHMAPRCCFDYTEKKMIQKDDS